MQRFQFYIAQQSSYDSEIRLKILLVSGTNKGIIPSQNHLD